MRTSKSKVLDFPRRPSRAGFTLLEVIAALVILSAVIFVLITGAMKCVAIARRAADFEKARHILARGELEHPLIDVTNRLDDLELDPVEYEDGYEFSRAFEEIEEEEDLFIVRTKVSWPGDQGKSKLEVLSYLYSTNHP